MLVHAPVTPVVNFVLMQPVMRPPGFLVNAAPHASQVRLAFLLWCVSGVVSLAIAAIATPVFRRDSESMAIWFLALSIAGFLTPILEGLSFLTMLSLSQQYVEAGSPADSYQALARLVGSARGWMHYANLLVGTGTALTFSATLFRLSLVPRLLSGFGILASTLGVVAVLMPMTGYPLVLQLLAPLGLAQAALMLWLLARGFTIRYDRVRGQTPGSDPPRATPQGPS